MFAEPPFLSLPRPCYRQVMSHFLQNISDLSTVLHLSHCPVPNHYHFPPGQLPRPRSWSFCFSSCLPSILSLPDLPPFSGCSAHDSSHGLVWSASVSFSPTILGSWSWNLPKSCLLQGLPTCLLHLGTLIYSLGSLLIFQKLISMALCWRCSPRFSCPFLLSWINQTPVIVLPDTLFSFRVITGCNLKIIDVFICFRSVSPSKVDGKKAGIVSLFKRVYLFTHVGNALRIVLQ